MSIEIECMDPKIAKRIVGGMLGKNINAFQIQGAGCVEAERWLEEQEFSMDWVALHEEGQLEALYVGFPSEELTEEAVRAVNDAYMLFKLSWMSREGVTWDAKHYVKCTLRNWRNKQDAA